MVIKITLTNKTAYTIAGVLMLVLVGVIVYSQAPNPGHEWNEIGGDTAALCSAVEGNCNVGGGSSLWQSGAGGIYYSAGDVGIGTSSPQTDLHVAGDVKIDGTLELILV